MKNSFTAISHLLAVAIFVIITNFFLNKVLLGNSPFIGFSIIVIGFCIDYLILMFVQEKITIFGELDLIHYLNIFFSSWIIYILFFLKDIIFNSSNDVKVIMLREHNINIIVSTLIILLLQHLNKKKINIYRWANIYLFSASVVILFLWRMIFTHLR
jgi:hypothetical protein